MTQDFAFSWGIFWTFAFGVLSIAGIVTGLPLPHSSPICFMLGGCVGIWIVGPIVWFAIQRS